MAQDLNRSIKIFIDSTDAMENYKKLTASTEKLTAKLKELRAAGKQDTAEFEKTRRARERDLKQQGAYINKIEETNRVLKNLSGATYGELETVRRQLRNNLKKTERGTVEYTEKLKVYHNVQRQITIAQKEMNGTLGAQSTVMSRVANGFNKYFGIVTSGLAAITGLSFTFRKLSKDAAEMEDVYADVMKTTGMTREEVGWMNEEFKKVDTRTSREELNKIAEEGGRIGIAKDQILEFVVAMDKANVALGDTFSGGVEEIASQLGKLKMLFEETKEMGVEDAYLSIASAINNLGAEGVASDQNISEFTTRIGSLPNALKPSIADTMALGAAFEESGIQAEIASRAYGIVLNRATTDTEAFARVMKMSVKEVEDLINTNPLEFFLQFSQSLRGMNAVETARTLDELKISADGANKVIGAAANNTERFRELIDLSNDSFREGASVLEEFNVKNNNAAAELDKRRKSFKDAAEDLGKRLNPALLTSTNYITYLVKLLPGFLDFMGQYGKYILYLATVYVGYVAGLKLSTFWNDKLKVALTAANIQLKIQSTLYTTGRVAGAAYNVVLGLLTGNITRARAAWALLNATLATTPFGLALAAVTALAGAFIVLRKNVSRARSEKDALSKINKDVAKSTANERAELERLLGVARNEKISKDERLKAIKQLNDISPEYLGNLTLENINTDAARKSVEDYTAALKENARQKAISGKMSELYAKLGNKEIDRAESERILEERRSAGLAQSDIDRSHQNRINRLNREIDNINQEIDAYQNLSESIYKNKQVDEGLVKWRENANKMGKRQLDAWIKNNKDAAAEYVKVAKEVYKSRFVDNVNTDGPGTNPDPSKDKSKKELEAFEEAHKAKMLTLKKQLLEENKTEKWFTYASVEIQEQYFKDKIALQTKLGESTVDTEMAYADFRLNIRKTADEQLIQQFKETTDSLLQSFDEYAAVEKDKLQEKADAGVVTQKEYRDQLLEIEIEVAKKRTEAAQNYLEEVQNTEFETIEARDKTLKEALEMLNKYIKEEQKLISKSDSDKLKEQEDHEKKRSALLDRYNLKTPKEKYDEELKNLKESLKEGLLTYEEYYKAQLKLRADFYAEYAQISIDVSDAVADAITAYHKLEADSLEAQKQRELAAAGNNAEEREKIEKKYAQKELDLRKKQATANATIQIAQATAAAAMAIANIWGQHAANPILAGVLTALSAATTAMQIAAIIKQRQVILATTLDVSSSGGSGSGSRVVSQRAKGKYDVIGADDGQLYSNVPYVGPARTGFISTPTLMGEQGRELVVSAPDLMRLQRHINYPLVIRALNDARSGVVPQRADGKYDTMPPASPAEDSTYFLDMGLLTEIRDLLRQIRDNPVRAYVLLSELHKKQELLSGSQKIGKK